MCNQIFICFAAEDRYRIVEPIVYHLRNYGIETWYDRFRLLLGDDRIGKNLIEGAQECKYALVVISSETEKAPCAMEELSIIEERHQRNSITVFPVLYEISPDMLPKKLAWVKQIIFKEANRQSGTREICNHIACKLTEDLLLSCEHKTIRDCLKTNSVVVPSDIGEMLSCYQEISQENLNSRVTMLYSCYLVMKNKLVSQNVNIPKIIDCVFTRLFAETKLHLKVNYRELWLLENSICLLVNYYQTVCAEPRM